MNKWIGLALAGLLAVSVQAPALVIGNWESMPNSGDGWIDWEQGQVPIETLPAKYSAGTVGATLGSQSLRVDQAGWAQSLAIKLDAAQRAAFMSSSTFSVDVSVRANDGTIEGGYSQIYAVYMNADGPGWTEVAGGVPLNFYWWPGSPERTQTLSVDYSSFRDAITSTGYIEIILALNTGGGAPTDMYFDNAQLTGVPEPTTLALLGTGALLSLRKRK
jgi:hypothetical protein